MSTEPDAKPLADAPETDEPSAPPTPYEMDRYECRPCGYTYEPVKGDGRVNIAPGVPFTDLPITWRCPVCGSRPKLFTNIGPAGKPSGFRSWRKCLNPWPKEPSHFWGLRNRVSILYELVRP